MKLIVACDPDGGIGYQNKLPWTNLQGDLPRFKALTQHQTVIMGRKTWDSLPKKPLLNRVNVVVSTQAIDLPPDVIHVDNVERLANFPLAWLIGGAGLIDQCWNWIYEIHLSRTLSKYTCDTWIDLIQLNDYDLVSSELHTDHTYEIWKIK
jgi:dihydrofolate reductase